MSKSNQPSKVTYNNDEDYDKHTSINERHSNYEPEEWNGFLSPNSSVPLEENNGEGDSHNDFNTQWTPEQFQSGNNSPRFSVTNQEQSFQPSQQTGAMIDTLGRSASTDSYDSFSTVIFKLLVSFEDLQKQLVSLLTPSCLALNMLLCRLLGTHSDLLSLVAVNRQASQHAEADRLANLSSIVDETVEADLSDDSAVEVDEMENFDENYSDVNTGSDDKSEADNRIRRVHRSEASRIRLVCGRGRRRIDNCRLIVEQVLKICSLLLNSLSSL